MKGAGSHLGNLHSSCSFPLNFIPSITLGKEKMINTAFWGIHYLEVTKNTFQKITVEGSSEVYKYIHNKKKPK